VKAPSRLDRRGEDAAASCAREGGALVLDRNFRVPGGELDLVIDDGGVIAFGEVKARASRACGAPAEAVTPTKVRRITLAALSWLAARGLVDRVPCRFDVFSVVEADGVLAVTWLKAAFEAAPLEDLDE
jgi:putative endonuclease